jgi:hypothetical protein
LGEFLHFWWTVEGAIPKKILSISKNFKNLFFFPRNLGEKKNYSNTSLIKTKKFPKFACLTRIPCLVALAFFCLFVFYTHFENELSKKLHEELYPRKNKCSTTNDK